MNWLQQAIGKEWNITPAGGLTGDAYIASKDDRRLFLKRNSSPFLAVLSAEGIVPKLVFTKRMENGDVITAQEWLDGRELKAEEMQHHRVADLLRKIHGSTELLHMLMRLGKKPVTPDEHFTEIAARLKSNGLLDQYDEVRDTIRYLKYMLPAARSQQPVVCHCDLNHNNIILTTDGQLYLVDWDNAMIADPAMDFGFILKWYVPKEDWDEWLEQYGASRDNHLFERMYWYLIMDALYYLSWHYERNELNKAQSRLADLRDLNDCVVNAILR
ncbi:phosphotransferase family protein [Lentibacillus sp.]|uniref:phosphotransferase family protein n=1 Tax=Lentibacillus sp. TaxID=1925746 RepID=UPI002B4AF9C3|nr:phosphotransferase family protein [Lentibacillus sp.]HLS09414.1 phosphotransferase family protein [Lentibacillus sp.]